MVIDAAPAIIMKLGERERDPKLSIRRMSAAAGPMETATSKRLCESRTVALRIENRATYHEICTGQREYKRSLLRMNDGLIGLSPQSHIPHPI